MPIPHLCSAQHKSMIFALLKPSSPLQGVLYEEQPNAKCLCSVNEEIDLVRNYVRERNCPQETAVSSLLTTATVMELITVPCILKCAVLNQ